MTTETSTRAATHSGHCQACGSLQKLPKGLLSLHGYKVEGGYFSGTCRGSRELPFELSCDLVKTFIVDAQRRLDGVRAWVQSIRDNSDATCWVRNYEKRASGRSGYVTRNVTVIHEPRSFTLSGETHTVTDKFYLAPGFHAAVGTDEKHKIDSFSHGGATPEETAHKLNMLFAEGVERTEVKQLERYISWQCSRVSTWTIAALLPVATKDRKSTFDLQETEHNAGYVPADVIK